MASADPVRRRTRFLVLTLLAIKPGHGYEIAKRLESLAGGFFRASTGSIYPVLRELKEEGLVEETSVVEQGRLRKVYRLTREGARQLLEELNVFTGITTHLLQIVAQARESLERLTRGEPTGCPPARVVEALRRLRDTVDRYLELLEERARECRGDGENEK